MRTTKNIVLLSILSALLLSGCGPNYQYNQARKLEKKGYYVDASLKYEKLAKQNPSNPRSPEALYRIGRIYQKKLRLYSQAERYFLKTADSYPNARPWSDMAKRELLNCPDYYPLTNGSFWIEGDSASGGRNMRAEWTCKEISSGTYIITRKISAGSRLVAKIERYFKKENMEFKEYTNASDPNYALIYTYPFLPGKEWKTIRDGRAITCRLIEKDITVKVKAGEFNGCIKISEENPNLPGSRRYNYYAPDVGWILTTTSASGQEFRNTELLSYKIMPEGQE